MRFRVHRSSRVCMENEVVRNICLGRKIQENLHDRFYKANFAILVSILRVFLFCLSENWSILTL